MLIVFKELVRGTFLLLIMCKYWSWRHPIIAFRLSLTHSPFVRPALPYKITRLALLTQSSRLLSRHNRLVKGQRRQTKDDRNCFSVSADYVKIITLRWSKEVLHVWSQIYISCVQKNYFLTFSRTCICGTGVSMHYIQFMCHGEF